VFQSLEQVFVLTKHALIVHLRWPLSRVISQFSESTNARCLTKRRASELAARNRFASTLNWVFFVLQHCKPLYLFPKFRVSNCYHVNHPFTTVNRSHVLRILPRVLTRCWLSVASWRQKRNCFVRSTIVSLSRKFFLSKSDLLLIFRRCLARHLCPFMAQVEPFDRPVSSTGYRRSTLVPRTSESRQIFQFVSLHWDIFRKQERSESGLKTKRSPLLLQEKYKSRPGRLLFNFALFVFRVAVWRDAADGSSFPEWADRSLSAATQWGEIGSREASQARARVIMRFASQQTLVKPFNKKLVQIPSIPLKTIKIGGSQWKLRPFRSLPSWEVCLFSEFLNAARFSLTFSLWMRFEWNLAIRKITR